MKEEYNFDMICDTGSLHLWDKWSKTKIDLDEDKYKTRVCTNCGTQETYCIRKKEKK